jgi:hypothetical protein
MPSTPPAGPYSLRNLEKDPAVIYMLDQGLRITYCNEAWDRFAAENGGRALERQFQFGRSVMDAIPVPLQRLFEESYRKVLATRKTWEHCYECSSPTHYRTFRMVVYPAPQGEGLVVVNSLTVERPHDEHERRACPPAEAVYVNSHGMIVMCCHCRRTRHAKNTAVWDWVPSNVEKPTMRISHGICAVCFNLVYPDFVDE